MSVDNHKSVLVIGIGSCILSDDGVASRVLHKVARAAPSFVEVIDVGPAGPEILDVVEGRKKTVIVDAIDAGLPPGTVLCFRPDEVTPAAHEPLYSLHNASVLFYIELAETLGRSPGEVVVVGIQPDDLSVGAELSPTVARAVPEAVSLVLAEVGPNNFHKGRRGQLVERSLNNECSVCE